MRHLVLGAHLVEGSGGDVESLRRLADGQKLFGEQEFSASSWGRNRDKSCLAGLVLRSIQWMGWTRFLSIVEGMRGGARQCQLVKMPCLPFGNYTIEVSENLCRSSGRGVRRGHAVGPGLVPACGAAW